MPQIRAMIQRTAVKLADLAGWLTIVDPILVEAFYRSNHPQTLLSVEAAPYATRIPGVVKRGIDVVGSVFALVFFLPLFLVFALLIKMTSKGPVFSRSKRVGFGGRPFTIYRFRTMFVDAEKSLYSLPPTEELREAFAFKIKNDPRVTRIGRFLRKTSMDELPQFWNVLKGEMTLVGPRPVTERDMESFKIVSRELVRTLLSVAPGMTGLDPLIALLPGSLEGRSVSDRDYHYFRDYAWSDRHIPVELADTELNLLREYLSNRSARLDFMILARTTHDWFRFRLLGLS